MLKIEMKKVKLNLKLSYSSSSADLNSLADFPKDFAKPGRRFAPNNNKRIVKITKSSGKPNLIILFYILYFSKFERRYFFSIAHIEKKPIRVKTKK